jgi:Phage tail tube protein
MANATSYGKLGYLMLKKESSAGTALYPDTPIEILSENIAVNWDITSVSEVSGKRSSNVRPVLNRVGPFTGTIEFYVEPNALGHFLCGLMGEDTHSTLSAGESEQSDFQPLNTLQSYTMDIKMGGEGYVSRYFGVRVQSISFSLEENKLKASVNVMAQRVFQNARVTTAVGSGTALSLDQTSGLTTSDSILVLDADDLDTTLATLTVTTVTDENTLVVSTIGASLAVDDVVVIAAQTLDTEDYDQADELIWSGGANVYIANGAHGVQNLSAKSNCESFELSIENDLEARWAATGIDVVDRMPFTILAKGVAVTGKFSQFHINPAFLDMLRENEQVTLRFQFMGASAIDSGSSAASATGVLESSGAGTVTTTVTATGQAGNDYAIVLVQGASTLSASLSGKLITVTLDVDAADNAVALVAAVIDALSNVTATSASTGNVTLADNPDKVHFSGGRDANEVAMLQFDLPNVRLMPFNSNVGSDEIMNEEIPFTAYWDENDEREIHVRLRNTQTAY